MSLKSNFSKSTIKKAKFLEKIAPIYTDHFLNKMTYRKNNGNGHESLIHFLKSYAYERQGAPAAYPEIASKCVKRKYDNGKGWGVPTEKEAMEIWKEYKRIAKEESGLWDGKRGKVKVNAKSNPMNPKKSKSNEGIITKLAQNKISSIGRHVNNLMKAGETKRAYNFLTGIRGVGKKISSFYLRDVVYLSSDLNENQISDLYLLQPIDTWLNQTLSVILENPPNRLRDKQRLIIKLCEKADISSIYFNQGAWVLGSQIAEEFGTLKKILQSTEDFIQRMEEHIEGKEKYLETTKQVIKKIKKIKSN